MPIIDHTDVRLAPATERVRERYLVYVSYTHLTLPTIYSV